MMARQYDDDTVLHDVTAFLGMFWEQCDAIPGETGAREKSCTTFEFKDMSFKNAVCGMMGQCLHACRCMNFRVTVCTCLN